MLGRVTTILGLLVVTAAVSACGGSGSNSGAAAAVNSARPSLEYVVRLSGATESPPTPGIGYAIVAFFIASWLVSALVYRLKGNPPQRMSEQAQNCGFLPQPSGYSPWIHARDLNEAE